MMKKINDILDYLDEIIIDPKCELIYKKDYELLIAVMLSAQTTDKRVNIVTKELFNRYKSLSELKEASLNDIESIVRSLGNYKKKSRAIIEIARVLDEDYKGIVPNTHKELEYLPMIGRKSANVVLSEIYDMPFIAVDTHVLRVSKRLGLASINDNPKEVEDKLNKIIKGDKRKKFHHQLVLFGRYHCKALNPSCDNCKLKKYCLHQMLC